MIASMLVIVLGVAVAALGVIPGSTDFVGAMYFLGATIVLIGGIGVLVRAADLLALARRLFR